MTDLIGLNKTLESGRTLLGTGWKTVESFDEIDDDEYEEDEEVSGCRCERSEHVAAMSSP